MKSASYFEGRSDAYRDAAEHLELIVKLKKGAFAYDVQNILSILHHDYKMFADAAEVSQIHAEMDEMANLEKLKNMTHEVMMSSVD